MRTREILRTLNVANLLTFLRLLALPFFVLATVEGRLGTAAVLFLAATVTDFLDGMIARALGVTTRLGALLDPAADKLLMTAGFVLLAEPSVVPEVEMVAHLPLWLTVLVIFRDLMIVGVSLALYLAYGVSRFSPTAWGKWTVFFEMCTLGSFLVANALGGAPPVLDLLVWITLVFVVVSGLDYLARTARWLAREERSDGTEPR